MIQALLALASQAGEHCMSSDAAVQVASFEMRSINQRHAVSFTSAQHRYEARWALAALHISSLSQPRAPHKNDWYVYSAYNTNQ